MSEVSAKTKRRIRFISKWTVKSAFFALDTALTIGAWEFGIRDWWMK